MENFVTFLLVCGVVAVAGQEAGPVGPIKFRSFGECEEPVNLVDFRVEMTQESDGTDSLKASFDSAVDIDDTATVTMHSDRCDSDGGNCEKNAYGIEDKDLFSVLNQFLGRIYGNLRSQMSPQIEGEDRIAAGAYSVEHFQADSDDVAVSQVSYGLFPTEISIAVDDEVVLCIQTNVEFLVPDKPAGK